jgi:cytochrome P450
MLMSIPCRFREWSKEYGSVFSLKLGSANVVVLCDRKAIHKLLVEKGANFSDRPDTYVGQILTRGDHVALQQMEPTWREKRKVISHTFSPKQLDEKHYKVQEAECVTLAVLYLRLQGFGRANEQRASC